MALENDLNAPDAYKGEVRNTNRTGLDDAGYKALWNANHTDAP